MSQTFKAGEYDVVIHERGDVRIERDGVVVRRGFIRGTHVLLDIDPDGPMISTTDEEAIYRAIAESLGEA